MRIAMIVVAACIALVTLGCATSAENMQVRTEYNRETNFTALKTFRMTTDFPTDGDYERYPKQDQIAREVVESELTARGYERITDGHPDFRVSAAMLYSGHKGSSDPTADSVSDPKPGPSSRSFKTATMLIRITHPRTKKMLWAGRVSGFQVDPIRNREDLRRAAWRALAEFPPL